MREYKSGTGWAVWRWSLVPSNYIVRLHLIKTPLGALCLHWLNGPDPEPWDHDHPVTFLSLILRGAYVERRNGKYRIRRWFNFIRADRDDRHSITAVLPGTLTLCLMGPKRREWGYDTPLGWIYWKTYNKMHYPA